MWKLIFSMVALAVFAGCASQDAKEQPGAAVEDRKPVSGEVKPPVKPTTAPKVTPVEPQPPAGRQQADRRQPAQRPEQHPVQAQHLLRLRQRRRQGRIQAAGDRACAVSHAEPPGQNGDPGQYRRARQPRIQPRAGPAARRRREADDDVARGTGIPDRNGQLRRGKAARGRQGRSVVFREPPQRHRLRWGAVNSEA